MHGRLIACRRCGHKQIVYMPLEGYSRFTGRTVTAAKEFPHLTKDEIGMLETGQCESDCVPWR